MREHRVEHGTENDDADNNAHPEAHMVNLLDTRAHVGDARAHIEFRRKRGMGDAPQNQDCQAALWPVGE